MKHSGITVNGQPLEDFLKDELTTELKSAVDEVIKKLKSSTIKQRTTQRKAIYSGRGVGKPKGLKRAKIYTREEIDRLNAERKQA